MRAWQVYHDGNILKLQWTTSNCASESVPVQRICSVTTEWLMLLTDDACLYAAELETCRKTLKFQLQREKVRDVDYCSRLRQLYVVTVEGLVYTRSLNIKNGTVVFGEWRTLSFDPLELSEEGIRIRRVCCSGYGAVFITYTNDIYVIGDCGDIFSVDAAQPKHMRLFDEATIDEVIDIVAGDEFFALLLRSTYDEQLDSLLQSNPIKKPINAITSKSSTASTSSKRRIQSAPLTPSSQHGSNAHSSHARQLTPEMDVNSVTAHADLNSNSSLHSYSGSSTKSSQASHEFESPDVTHQLLKHGYSLLHTNVHTFGSANNGLLGTGDHIKRGAINHVKKLDDIGVCSIAAGKEHTVVRTLDGRLLHWGLNSKQQLQPKLDEQNDLSAPTECDIAGEGDLQRSVLAACCGDFRTVLLNARGELYVKQSKLAEQSMSVEEEITGKEKDFLSLHLSETSAKREFPLLLASGDFTVHNQRKFRQEFYNALVTLQTQLKQLLKSMNTVNILQLFQQERNGTALPLQQLQHVCLSYRKILCLVAAAVRSLESFYRGDFESPADLLFIKHHREYIALFEAYTRANCDVYSIDGYTKASKILTSFTTLTVTPSSENAQKSVEQIDLVKIFQQPLHIVPGILQFLEQLSKTQREYAEHLMAWQAYARQNTINLELAENTLDFWQRNERNLKIRHFRRRHRRVILTSSSVPLKLSQHGISISSPTFILFSDCLCQLSSQLYTFPLVAMWLKIESDTALRITTPEKSFILTARSHHDKMLWYDQLESSILAALGRPQGSKLSGVRTTTYVFSNSHAKYAGVHAYGRWRNGLLHGNCYLEYPDGRFYFGEMRNGEIEGYGKMVIPAIGLYEGTFKAGKFHGHGTYEMKDNEVYEGNFRDGLFHGHGLLRNNHYTYVGEYQANAKSGYGVLDDMATGDKYMGMFADNKRIGAGTCITMTGDYFEGIFSSDELAGAGIAVFENDYYYEGELSMNGPCGKGTYYMPSGVVEVEDASINDDDDISSRVLVGNIISGQLSGSWQNVRVISGNVAINQQFSKYPKSIGELVVDNQRKWRSLFENFEEQILGATNTTSTRVQTENASSTALNTARMYWNRIAIFMTAQREREKALEQDTLSESRHSYFARNISMGFASRSFDRLSLKSTHSLFSEGTFHDLKCSSNRLIKLDASPMRSQSQETLYDSALDLNELSFHQPQGEDLHSFSGQLANWANDTMNGYCGNSSSSGYVQNGMGTATSSLRSSYDSVFNLNTSLNNNNSLSSTGCSQNSLEYVPNFGITSLNESDIISIKEYLSQAFKDRHHPLYFLNQRIANCFYISYGCWKVKPTPILASQAMHEWECMTRQIYRFVRKLFPALPEDYCVIESTREVISHITLLYPIVLTEGIYSTLFVLYANKYSRKDELYRQNLIYAEKLSDDDLALQLSLESTLLAVVSTSLFADAIQTLKQLQEKHSPKAMLGVIELCMQLITDAHKMVENANAVILAADSMMPLTLFLVLRAAVPHLGAELALLDDLTGGANFQFEMNGIAGYCYTTLKAAYEHITAKPLYNKTT